MYPDHLARLDDDGSVPPCDTGTAGGASAPTSPEGPEVPVSAPLRSVSLVDPWPLSVEGGGSDQAEAWPLLDVDALQSAGAEDAPDAPADVPAAGRGLTPREVVAAVARGARHRHPSTRSRKPTLYLAAALIGAAGVAVAATSGPSPAAAQADEPVSVAEELGMVQAEQPALTQGEATSRLQQLVASRAARQDAEVAAAQVQAQADQAAVQAAAAAAEAAAAAAAAAEAARPQAVLPVQGARLSSGFGSRWGTLHAGVDFAAPIGTPEYAAMDGVVVRAGAASGFGLAVYIQHANGDVTVYGHMEQILVAEGQAVTAGETIALLGNRGQSTGPHLHFEVHLGGMDGEKVDPLPWLRDRGVQV